MNTMNSGSFIHAFALLSSSSEFLQQSKNVTYTYIYYYQRIGGFLNGMSYINPRFIYLLTYLLRRLAAFI